MHYIWTPVLPPDDRASALASAERLADPRAIHYWDDGQTQARGLADVLKIRPEDSIGEDDRGLAWDVYLAYGRGRDIGEAPDFWMHQLNVKHAPRLNVSDWYRTVAGLLAK